MEQRRIFQMECPDRISAEVIKFELEEIGFMVEPPGEYIPRKSRHQHKKPRGAVNLIFSIPSDIKDGTPEMIEFERRACSLASI